jgi:hypothetical protein
MRRGAVKGRERLRSIYHNMKLRCTNPNTQHYDYYGGRGIRVCKRWMDSFEAFAAWALRNGYTDTMSLDRRNVDGNYSPQNCEWIPGGDQAINRRSTIMIDGMPLRKYCERHGLNYNTVKDRRRRGWSLERAVRKE